jgi:hypothetical protein
LNEEIKQSLEVIKDPTTFSALTYIWVALIAAWGGLVRFLNSRRERKETLGESLMTLITGLITSVFVGVLTFYACEIADFDKLWTAICVAVTGHLGAQAMQLFEKAIISRLRVLFGISDNDPRETP